MHKSIRLKLFIILLLTTFSIVAGMYVFMRWSLNKGFSELIEARQQERVSNLIDGLTDYYAKNQGWGNLAKNKQKWIELLLQSNPRQRTPSWIKQALAEADTAWPPQLTQEQIKRNLTPLEFRLMLLDSNKKFIFGCEDCLEKLTLTPIHYQGQTIGYLGLLPGKAINHVSEIRFIERQSKSFILITLSMICLSASLALLLAYLLGRPLKLITTAAKTLAVGNYDIRLPIESNDELGQLARDFNDLAAALEQSEQSRRRWVADISHELRTPLAILRAELEALQDGIRPITRDAVDSILNSVLRLNRLTDDLYQLSLSDQGALTYRKAYINPLEVLKEDVDTLRSLFESKNITINLDNKLSSSVYIYADPDRISQLYRNILNNSINYTDNDGSLVIGIYRDTDTLIIQFSDSAPGISEEDLNKMFDRFYRVDHSRNSYSGGAGLGLAICSNIVKAHAGIIKAFPSTMNGVCIHLEFPISV